MSFTIAAAQIPSIRGDLRHNMDRHLRAIEVAANHGVSVLIFPELSLIGYEPNLAKDFALSSTDSRLAPIAQLAQRHQIHVVIGAPIKNDHTKPFLGAFVITEQGSVRTYAKMHLGGTESNYFAPGTVPMTVELSGQSIGLAICADSSQNSHPATYASKGATIYAASVFLNAEWYVTDSPRLSKYAADYQMLVVMANHAASVGTLVSVGNSSIWAPDGSVVARAVGTETALVLAKRTTEKWIGKVIDFCITSDSG